MSCMAERSRRRAGAWAAVLAGCAAAAPVLGEEAKKPEPPVLRVVQPLGVEPGEPVRWTVRGQRLDGVTSVQVAAWPGFQAEVVSRGDAPGINGLDAARVGDRRLELKATVPLDAVPGTNAALVVSGTNGVSAAFPLVVVRKGLLLGETEPNDGFRDAPGAPVPSVLRGGFAAKGDVDVFRVSVPAGRRLRAEVLAERAGSTLDAMLTVYDARRATVASVDDTAGRDPVVEFESKEGGEYFVAVSYANDQAAPTHDYLLYLTLP